MSLQPRVPGQTSLAQRREKDGPSNPKARQSMIVRSLTLMLFACAGLHSAGQGQEVRRAAAFASDRDEYPIAETPPPQPQTTAVSPLIALHGQTTFTGQYALPFRAPYYGANSLEPNAARETWDATFVGGVRLWSGAELWANPELDQGFGLSGTLGIAGFASGEAYKVGARAPYTRLPRVFVRQIIDLGGESLQLDADLNQFARSARADRLVLTLGKFAVTDVFEVNRYAHDPHVDFLNWAVVDAGTFDYAADSWGYTYGLAAEWYAGSWTLRAALFDLSSVPNSPKLDPSLEQFQMVSEIEHRHHLWGQPGKVAVTQFLTRGRMARFADAIAFAQQTGRPVDPAPVRRYQGRGGVSVNLEQQVSAVLGMFVRAGSANGDIEPYEFTDIDRTVALGAQLDGTRWGRADDRAGVAAVVNDISTVHRAFLAAGGLGILVGDGRLPHPGLENILETYYSLPIWRWRATLDYQLVLNPGYNRDRGPASILGVRLHAQL